MANFNLFIPILQKVEAGYQNLSSDRGNYNSLGQRVGTNFGISARFYEGIINRPPTVQDMKNITKTSAQAMYKKYFWDDVQGDIIENQSIANVIADHAVNGGENSIGLIVQRILVNDFNQNVTVDGDIGVRTAQAINAVNQQILFDKIKAARANFYNAIGGTFLNGWLDRLTNFTFSIEKKKQRLA